MERSRRQQRPRDLIDLGPPFDLDAERAVLGCILLAPSLIDEVSLALAPSDFHGHATRTIFGAMLRIKARGAPIDVALLPGELRDHGEYSDEDGVHRAELHDLFWLVPTAVNCSFYVARVLEMSRRRYHFYRGQRHLQAAHANSNGAKQRGRSPGRLDIYVMPGTGHA